ncbi:membrane bound O-acyl transferase family-domain-containing protein [Mycena vitilis]|nr:membrane bound O-acyl transferase family-domain-containing protein [Mycena vitilis]
MPLETLAWQPSPHTYPILYIISLFTSLIIRPFPRRRLFFAPILVLTWRLLYDAEVGYLMSTAWFSYLIIASDYILVTNVQRELHQVPDSTDKRSLGNPIRNIENAPLKSRIQWALQLFFNARGVGWAHEPRCVFSSRAPPNTPRIDFIARQVGSICANILLFDLANLHSHWNPGFSQHIGMVAAGWRWRVVGTAAWALGAASAMSAAHCAASILCVALGVSRPQDWPPLFGSLADAASVRTFWARGWHQLLRRSLCAHAKFISNKILRLPDGTVASSCTEICSAFALSGLVHYMGESVPMGHGHSGSLIFFGIQPAAIAFETLLRALFNRTGVVLPTTARKALGYVWVFGWFVLTCRILCSGQD